MIAVQKIGWLRHEYVVWNESGNVLARGVARTADRAEFKAMLLDARFRLQAVQAELSGRNSGSESPVADSGSEFRAAEYGSAGWSAHPRSNLPDGENRRGFVGQYNPYVDQHWHNRSV